MLSDGSNASTNPVNPALLNDSPLIPVPAPISMHFPSRGTEIPKKQNDSLDLDNQNFVYKGAGIQKTVPFNEC